MIKNIGVGAIRKREDILLAKASRQRKLARIETSDIKNKNQYTKFMKKELSPFDLNKN